jgi:hypothetical protein
LFHISGGLLDADDIRVALRNAYGGFSQHVARCPPGHIV